MVMFVVGFNRSSFGGVEVFLESVVPAVEFWDTVVAHTDFLDGNTVDVVGVHGIEEMNPFAIVKAGSHVGCLTSS